MTDKTCMLEWKNDVTGKTICRTIPKLYLSDLEEAARLLERGLALCIGADSFDLCYATPYIARALSMAEPGETIVYPDGRVITVNYRRD